MRTLILLTLLISRPAYASPAAFAAPQIGVNAHAGVGAPLGFYGVALELAPSRWLSVEAGIGKGLTGTQLALLPRARVARLGAVSAFAIGAGVSGGSYERRDPFWGIEYIHTGFERALWVNVEASIESRPRSWLQLRAYAGVGTMFYGDKQSCDDGEAGHVPCDGTERGTMIPYLGASVGYTFDR